MTGARPMPVSAPSTLRAASVAAAAVLVFWAGGALALWRLAEAGRLDAGLAWQVSASLAILLGGAAWVGFRSSGALLRSRLAAAADAVDARGRLIVDAAADAILTFAYQGRIESFNAAAVRMFGYEPGEVLGRDVSMLISTTDKSDMETLLQSAVATGGGKILAGNGTFVGKHKDGRVFPVELGVSRVIDEDRRLYVQIVRDLSERQRHERQQRMQYEAAQVLADGIRPQDASRRVLEVIGESMGWPAGQLWRANAESGLLRSAAWWSKGEAGARLFAAAAGEAAHAQGSGLPGQAWLRRELCWQGKPTDAARPGCCPAIAWPVELEDQILGVLEFYAAEIAPPDEETRGCLYPVATQLAQFLKRKADEESLRQALVAAEDANQAKSEFLANISHEIRTPLNGIMGLTELTLGGELEAGQREQLELVQSSAGTLLGLVNDLLDFAKIEANRMDLEAVPFAVREALEPTLRTLAARAAQKGLGFRHAIEAGVPQRLVGDPLRLQQVLFNLVGNAIKFTESGEVAVTLSLAARTAREAVLHGIVADTGIGIPLDKQEAVFAAFSQADGSLARKYGGTGLGLTISSRLVALMGGRVWVESKEGKGSTFHFTACLAAADEEGPALPLAGSDDGGWAAARPPEPAVFGRTVLVVEDNPVNRVLLELILQKRQHKTVFATTGTEAVRAWEEQAFDLVLMDVQLPEMDGREATRRICAEAERQGRKATVVGLTALASSEDRERCIRAGMAAYLAKPVQPAELLEAIDRLLRGIDREERG